MKLLLCPKCGDVIVLKLELRSCHCGSCSGKYVDDLNAVYNDGIPMGIDNNSIVFAIRNYKIIGHGFSMNAFAIDPDCKTYKKEEII